MDSRLVDRGVAERATGCDDVTSGRDVNVIAGCCVDEDAEREHGCLVTTGWDVTSGMMVPTE